MGDVAWTPVEVMLTVLGARSSPACGSKASQARLLLGRTTFVTCRGVCLFLVVRVDVDDGDEEEEEEEEEAREHEEDEEDLPPDRARWREPPLLTMI
jgi:hypothetical protein